MRLIGLACEVVTTAGAMLTGAVTWAMAKAADRETRRDIDDHYGPGWPCEMDR